MCIHANVLACMRADVHACAHAYVRASIHVFLMTRPCRTLLLPVARWLSPIYCARRCLDIPSKSGCRQEEQYVLCRDIPTWLLLGGECTVPAVGLYVPRHSMFNSSVWQVTSSSLQILHGEPVSRSLRLIILLLFGSQCQTKLPTFRKSRADFKENSSSTKSKCKSDLRHYPRPQSNKSCHTLLYFAMIRVFVAYQSTDLHYQLTYYLRHGQSQVYYVEQK